jgi:putative heme-binding domain-containing protein
VDQQLINQQKDDSMLKQLTVCAMVLCLMTIWFAVVEAEAKAADPVGQWIWVKGAGTSNDHFYFRKTFDIQGGAKALKGSMLTASCDNNLIVTLNGKVVARSSEWQQPAKAPVHSLLKPKGNVIAIEGWNAGGQAALYAKIEIQLGKKKKQVITTDASWQVSTKKVKGWTQASFDAKSWPKAVSIGKMGMQPWGNVLSGAAGGGRPAKANQDVRAPEGFKVESIYTVPKGEQGSWVSLTVDGKGDLIAADQGGKGLYRIKLPALGSEDEAKVSKIPVDISNAHGMVWAFNSLYVNRNGSGSGLWRVTDSDGDGELDKSEQLIKLAGGGEHGPHAVVVTEDGKGLYFIGGNHTNIPSDLTGSRMTLNWGEDLLLPRQWDARGHARGKLAPGGWVCRVSPDGKQRVLYSTGYRNQYDIALNREGDIFTFDSDMEWDLGSPWYRPTRVCNAVSGSEFGWRSGTGKWATYYPDSLPPVVDIGPASPTGVVFGYGTKFPSKWHEALYILDWTYGTIWAIHLSPDGASYSGKVEEFISGAPLPVTDAIVGKDRAFYFAVGGRGTQSALYRVTHESNAVPKAPTVDPKAKQLRQLRRKLEKFHGVKDASAVAAAWPHLSHEDRFIRFAARVAIEHQPVSQWKTRALAEKNPQALITAMVALARHGKPQMLDDVLTALARIKLASIAKQQQLEAYRAYALAFIRLGKPSAQWRNKVIAKLDPLYPSTSDETNIELLRLLVYLDAPTVIEKTIKMMANPKPTPKPEWSTVLGRNSGYGGTVTKMLANQPPLQNIRYAFALRNVRFGWTIPQREIYFKAINEAGTHPGGASYPGFLKNIRAEALKNCSESERRALAGLTGERLSPLPKFKITKPKGPGIAWTKASALKAVGKGLSGRSFESGRNIFYATGCAACHRFDGAGGAVGPDLSSVANKYSYSDLLENIVEPSKVISDQYGSSIISLKDGSKLMGLAVGKDDKTADTFDVYTIDPNAPPIKVKRSDVASIKPSPISQMPTGLINVLNNDELLDLLAYLMSRGNPKSPVFNK